MLTKYAPILAIALAFGAPIAPALAQSGAEGVFTVHNDTETNVIIGFYVGTTDDSFSDNWLSDPLMPGETARAEFESEEGSCINYFVVGWLGADMDSEVLDDPVEIDICEATNVYLGDSEITFD
jgi:hypothetical protein